MRKSNVAVKIINVHPGIFHADDAMAAALIQYVYPDAKIVRGIPENGTVNNRIGLDDIIVADIGLGRYDHHQNDVRRREDGKKRAACGLVFDDLKDKLFRNNETADKFEKDYIIPIEDSDNGEGHDALSAAISSLNPEWDTEVCVDDLFFSAVDMMKKIIERAQNHERAVFRASSIIDGIYQKNPGEVVVLPQYIPWVSLIDTDAKFVIYPSIRGGYNLQALPIESGSYVMKEQLPEQWLGEKPTGCSFVHPARFIAAFDTEKHACTAAATMFGANAS